MLVLDLCAVVSAVVASSSEYCWSVMRGSWWCCGRWPRAGLTVGRGIGLGANGVGHGTRDLSVHASGGFEPDWERSPRARFSLIPSHHAYVYPLIWRCRSQYRAPSWPKPRAAQRPLDGVSDAKGAGGAGDVHQVVARVMWDRRRCRIAHSHVHAWFSLVSCAPRSVGQGGRASNIRRRVIDIRHIVGLRLCPGDVCIR